MGYSSDGKRNELDTDALRDVALALLADHSKKHAEMRAVRNLVRQRTMPEQVLTDKYLLSVRSAVAWAIVNQWRSLIGRATRSIEVVGSAATETENRRTSKNERWLIGSSDMVNQTSGFVESAAISNGIELGEMILGASFNAHRAKMGKFGIEVVAPDPECSAYARSHYGLTHFVSQESRTVAALRDELRGLAKRSKGVFVSDKLNEGKLTDLCEDLRLYTETHEVRWIDSELVYARRHFCGRVPFDIAYFGDMPSDLPEEWGRGVISPVRDLLENQQKLLELFITDAELGAHPTAILFDGRGKYEIVQLALGEQYGEDNRPGSSLIPIPYNSNQQLLHEIATAIAEQVDLAAIPRSTFVGASFQLSGYAAEQFNEGIRGKVEDAKQYPERALGAHLALRLQLVRKFATREIAKSVCPDDPDRYLNSFSVLDASRMEGAHTGAHRSGSDRGNPFAGSSPSNRKSRGKHMLAQLTADDVAEDPRVLVSLTPNIPAQRSLRVQQLQAALAAGLPYQHSVREIYEPDDVDELLNEHHLELLMAGDDKFKTMYLDYLQQELFKRNPTLGKFNLVWMREQGLLPEEGKEGGRDGAMERKSDGAMEGGGGGEGGEIPPDLMFQPGNAPPGWRGEGGVTNPMQALAAVMAQGAPAQGAMPGQMDDGMPVDGSPMGTPQIGGVSPDGEVPQFGDANVPPMSPEDLQMLMALLQQQ